MNLDSELYRAEDEAIKHEVFSINDTETLRQWISIHGCNTHPVILDKFQELEKIEEARLMNENQDELLSVMEEYEEEKKEKMKYQCTQCHKSYKRHNELLVHIRSAHENILFSCDKCNKKFAYKNSKTRHEKTCTKTTKDQDINESLKQQEFPPSQPTNDKGKGIKCKICGIYLKGKREINNHHHENSKISLKNEESQCQPGPSTSHVEPRKTLKCRTCGEAFENRRKLYLHKNVKHQTGQGVKSMPWKNDTTPHSNNDKFKEVYEANKKFILEDNKEGKICDSYNIPSNNDISVDSIVKEIESIATHQQRAFKINISFGVIIRHVETGDLRYFIPDQNETLLDQPFLISSMEDLRKLKQKLETLDLNEFIMRTRKDTKWKVFFLTNMKITLFKPSFLFGAAETMLPDYIEKHPAICALSKNKKGRYYKDNLCLFRCLALHMGQRNKLEETKKLNFTKYMKFSNSEDIQINYYLGFPLEDMHRFEKCFQVNVNIFELNEDGIVYPFRISTTHYDTTMNLNRYHDHLSYISKFTVYSKKYQCPSCKKCFPSAWRCLKHSRCCVNKTKFIYPGGFHHQQPCIFERLDEYGIHIDRELRYFPYFVVYDFEALLSPTDSHQPGKLKWQAEHLPISVSVCSNIPGYTEPQCFVNTDSHTLVSDMIKYMTEIAEATQILTSERWEEVFIDINEQINEWETDDLGGQSMIKALKDLEESFERYTQQLPVLGFNSSNYDLNLIKKHIAAHLRLYDTKGLTVKKNNSYTCIANDQLKFLDISNYLAAGTSYAKFLKAYGIEETKGFFPYEYMTNADKLNETSLPPHEAFYSSLKGKNITEEEYAYCQEVWKHQNMRTMKDFLVWYNNLDVYPMTKATEKLQEFYFLRDIDVFKVTMTVPGIARQMLFQASKSSGASFALFGERDKDLFKTIKNNIVGGPSIIFNRHSKAGSTYIRNNKDKLCQKILGFDANALYLWALDQAMPTGTFVRRLSEKGFAPESRDSYASAYHWMDWLTETTPYNIKHKLNYSREKRIGPYPVDGFCSDTSTIFQFHGCYFHGHDCDLTRNINDKKWRESRKSKYENTTKTSQFIRQRNYTLIEIWECEFISLKKRNNSLMEVIDQRSPSFYRTHKKKVNESQILNTVKEGQLFGMIEVDISVPEQWPSHFQKPMSPYEYFEEMAPLFCTTEIPFDIIGQHMQNYVKKHSLSEKPRRLLVGGMKAKKLLLASPLLAWYLNHGLQVTNIYQVIEYTPMRCFKSFVCDVTEARRQGDVNPDMKIIADTCKTIGNSAYGGLIMDKTKHTNIKYVKGDKTAQDYVNKNEFMNITHLDNDLFEVELSKKIIRLDLPVQLGFFILQYGKLRMLEFYYDFMDTFCRRSDFAYCEMDTDSAYMAISGQDLKPIIKLDMMDQYLKGLKEFCCQKDVATDSSYHWFPRECCAEHNRRDMRTPGLFKLEYEGNEIIGLCSKTYIVSKSVPISINKHMIAKRLLRKAKGLRLTRTKTKRSLQKQGSLTDFKYSCKGISKRSIQNPLHIFKNVLRTGRSSSGINKGFRVKNNMIHTYQQERSGFSYFYCKRQVQDNGIDTKVLNITLCPEK